MCGKGLHADSSVESVPQSADTFAPRSVAMPKSAGCFTCDPSSGSQVRNRDDLSFAVPESAMNVSGAVVSSAIPEELPRQTLTEGRRRSRSPKGTRVSEAGKVPPSPPAPQFQHQANKVPVFVELFAGSCGLSKSMLQRGFQVIAVDHAANARIPKVRVLPMDLRTHDSWVFLRASLEMLHGCILRPPVALHRGRLNRRSSCVCVLSSVRFSCYHVFFTLRVLLDFSMVSAVGFHAHVFHLTLFLRPTFEPWFS